MDTEVLANTPLFHGIRSHEITQLLPCLGMKHKHYDKDELILRAGDVTESFGIIEQGSANIVVNSYWGDSTIIGHVYQGEIFATAYAAIPDEELRVDVIAADSCSVVFFSMNKVLTSCNSACAPHHRLIQNMVRLSAKKNLSLTSRMLHIAPKSIRKRLLSYLSEQAQIHGSSSFEIPFSRQQLADYLGVDRSALSNELSKMQRDGIISYRKNRFTLHEVAEV